MEARRLARQLEQQGLPLQRRILDLARGTALFDEPCSSCVYVRLGDNDKSPRCLYRTLRALIKKRNVPKSDRLPTRVLLLDALSNDRDGAVEIVSSCGSRECDAVLRSNFSSFMGSTLQLNLTLATRRAGAVEALGRVLRVSPQNTKLVFDQLRCARCEKVVGVKAALNSSGGCRYEARGTANISADDSSFYQMALRLNRQLRRGHGP